MQLRVRLTWFPPPLPIATVLFLLGLSSFAPSGSNASRTQAEEVVSVTLSPSTIDGGSGGTATGTVTLSAPAPAGGAVVTLASSNIELAATLPQITVPEGQSAVTFSVATNAGYRRYSGLQFTVTISASRFTTRTADLTVTAQPRPADFNSGSTAGANTQWDGLMCGGIAPIGGQKGILYSCSPADDTGFGTCTFQQECSLGCRRVPPNGQTYSDFCATSGPNPVALSRNYVASGDRVAATIVAEAPAGAAQDQEQGVPGVISLTHNASYFPHDGSIGFPDGATSVPFDVATSYVPTIEFADVVGYWFNASVPPLLITNGRAGHAWLVMIPPNPPPPIAVPTLGDFKITGLNPITGGDDTFGQIDLSGLSRVGGPTFTLTSSHPDIVPSSTIDAPASESLLGFQVPISTNAPVGDTDVTLTATDGRYNFSGVLTVKAPAPPPVLGDLTVAPSSVTGGTSAVGTVVLSSPQSDPTVVQISIIETAPATLPSDDTPCPSGSRCHHVTVPAGETSAAFTISTSAVTSQFNLNIYADLAGSPTQQALLLIMPGGDLAPKQLTVSPVDLVGGNPTTGVVTLTAPAPAGGASVALAVALANGGSGTVPASVASSVTVPEGQTSASFPIATSTVTSVTVVRASASLNGVTASADFSLFPLLGQVSFSSDVAGGTPATGTVSLRAAAPADGAIVTLVSADPSLVSVPTSVTVPAGQTSTTFVANTSEVTSTTGVSVSASHAGATVTTTLFLFVSTAVSSVTLNPATVTGGSESTGTVTLRSAPSSNAVVTLASSNTTFATVPNSVTVLAGQTSANFTVNTAGVASTVSVEISATHENVTATATLTISAGGTSGTVAFVGPTANAPDSGGDGNGFQSNPTNAHVDDSAVASDSNSGTGTSTSCTNSRKDRHRFYDFGLVVPEGSAVAGIEVRLDARADSTSGSPRMCVQLSWDGGANWTTPKATSTLGTSLASLLLGSSTDTWGRAWGAAEVTNAKFRVRVINVAGSTARDFFLEWIGVRLHLAAAGTPTLHSIAVTPTSIVGGNTAEGTVTLSSGAPSTGSVVALSSSNTAVASVPTSVTIAAGALSATFGITTASVDASADVVITGTYDGVTRSTNLTVNPPTIDAILTVTASGRSGERVLSSPAGIDVSVGSTQSAAFPAGTSITLSVSDGRDAIWSGACSSGGEKQRSCTFTLTADATVSADVQ